MKIITKKTGERLQEILLGSVEKLSEMSIEVIIETDCHVHANDKKRVRRAKSMSLEGVKVGAEAEAHPQLTLKDNKEFKVPSAMFSSPKGVQIGTIIHAHQ